MYQKRIKFNMKQTILFKSVSDGYLSNFKRNIKTRGIDGGLPKRPFAPFNEAHRATLDNLINKYNL